MEHMFMISTEAKEKIDIISAEAKEKIEEILEEDHEKVEERGWKSTSEEDTGKKDDGAKEADPEKHPSHRPEGDSVFRPAHYTQYKAMEPFTFMFLNNVPFAEATACTYVLRWRKKNGIEDLRKAMRVIEMMIEMETNKEDYTPKKGCL